LLADRDPEGAQRRLDPFLDRMMEAVHRYEGTVNHVSSDGIMALFGAPLAHEDHAARACCAALAMQKAVLQCAKELSRANGVRIQLLKSGGILHLFDSHPVTWPFDPDARTYVASGFNYFTHGEVSQGWPSTHIGVQSQPVEQQARKFKRVWPVATVFQALRRVGLVIENLGEHPETFWEDFPNLRPELQGHIPRTFSMVARRP
jgi:hypothetical protein